MRNFGQHNALMCGLRHAQGNLIVTIDDDLQTPPEEIPKLVEKILRGPTGSGVRPVQDETARVVVQPGISVWSAFSIVLCFVSV